MFFFQLVGAAVEYGTAQLVHSELGFAGLVLLTVALVGIRTGQPRLAGWSAFLFLLLTFQLQS
ncbi:hypothetical protein ACIP79_33850 [Streptomyces sp. NPDC088747]|uniref:hypothetical protein n=1 Tax=Streptomyces sp. NPDC088747 TaxID=3365886 RepID=UPI00380490BE